MLLPVLLALTQYVDGLPRVTIPDTAPMYCYNSLTHPEPLVGTDFGMFRRAFLERFQMRVQMFDTGESGGLLRFTSKENSAEVINFDVVTYSGDRGPGVLLMDMRSQATALPSGLDGTPLCWLLFGVVHDR